MKSRMTIFAAAISIIMLTSVAADAQQVDLSMRLALYMTGTKVGSIDESVDKYVAANKSITVSQGAATKCDNDGCTFNVGIIAWRTLNGKEDKHGDLSTYGLFEFNGSMVGNTLYFHDGEGIVQFVQAVKLKLGSNKVTFKIDPYNKTPESNESNNSFTVTVQVAPKVVPRPQPVRRTTP